jgi:hypothetical protein
MLLLLGLDRHCRSHNIAAECCVGSSGKSRDDFESMLSKAGGRELREKVLLSRGSCLMVAPAWKMLSAGDAGLGYDCSSM